MANEDNIKPYKFKKGQSGNPRGRARGKRNTKTIIIREFLSVELDVPTLNGEKRLRLDSLLIGGLFKCAIYGNSVAAYRLLLEKIDKIEKEEENSDEILSKEDLEIMTLYIPYILNGKKEIMSLNSCI